MGRTRLIAAGVLAATVALVALAWTRPGDGARSLGIDRETSLKPLGPELVVDGQHVRLFSLVCTGMIGQSQRPILAHQTGDSLAVFAAGPAASKGVVRGRCPGAGACRAHLIDWSSHPSASYGLPARLTTPPVRVTGHEACGLRTNGAGDLQDRYEGKVTALPRASPPLLWLPVFADLNLIASTTWVLLPLWILGLLAICALRSSHLLVWLLTGALAFFVMLAGFRVWLVAGWILTWPIDLALALSVLLIGSSWILTRPGARRARAGVG